MPFKISLSIRGRTAGSIGDQLFAMTYGTTAVTPRNLDQMLSQMRGESAVSPLAGKRQHKPITITKEWGAASPQLLNAHWTSEVLQTVVIEIKGPSSQHGGGQETVYHTISLTNAQIVGYTRYVPPLIPKHSGGINTNELERFGLIFQKITFTNVKGSKSTSDDWLVP